MVHQTRAETYPPPLGRLENDLYGLEYIHFVLVFRSQLRASWWNQYFKRRPAPEASLSASESVAR
jgi:hypothetical protein